MQTGLIDSFVASLTKPIDLMRTQKEPSRYSWDIQNLDKIRFYFAGLEDDRKELMERLFREKYRSLSITKLLENSFIS